MLLKVTGNFAKPRAAEVCGLTEWGRSVGGFAALRGRSARLLRCYCVESGMYSFGISSLQTIIYEPVPIEPPAV